jgi:hypothetical protein
MRTLMVAAAMALAMGAAQAQPPMPSHYAWSKGPNSISLHLRKDGQSAVKTVTKSCLGDVGGVARVTGRAVVLEEDGCVLNITFSRNYTRAYIREKNCRHWHGANCTFDGALIRQ